MNDLVAILASVTVVSLISFVGVIFIGLKESLLRRIVMALVGFASGTLLGGAFFDLLPEAVNMINPPITIFYFVTLGIIVFFCIEKFLYWRHCHEEECQVHTFAYISLVGDGVHNFIDGMIIAATFVFSFELGFITTLAVISHEIPQEIGDFGVLIYGGLSKRKALTYNFISALTAILGAIVTYYVVFLRSNYALLVPFAAGGFIYIAATDLMPELHKKSHAGESIIQLLSILFGLGLMAYLTSLIHG
ncbi:MAG: ZIP family metal transporter [Candidatus Bathyarchaeia archaeon]|jgi:zinc and cadmium transporter